ncbi:nucleotidyltransferase family protein [Verrucomicrobiota bacterium sgz303538]
MIDPHHAEIMQSETLQLIRKDEWRMNCLEAVRRLHLPDWYLAAGFLRNAIWDHLHQYESRTPLNDVDLVFYDPSDLGTQAEQQIESVLKSTHPGVNWEVRNQARMHLRNHHAPYQNSEHAIGHWIEIPTCVGVRLEEDDLLVIAAPFGLAENFSLRVAPNPNVPYPPELFRSRVTTKRWLELWPKLTIVSVKDSENPGSNG